MAEYPEQRAIIAGIGISRIGRRLGIPHLELTAEAASAAIADAGLAPSDIDGVLAIGDTTPADTALALGIEASLTGGGFGPGGLLSPVMDAAVAVGEARVRNVLVYRTVQMIGGAVTSASGAAPPPRADEATAPAVRAMGDMSPLIAYHGYSAVNYLAMHCQRHMYLYGTTKEQLGWLAVNSRRNAGLNPLAVYRDPMTLDDYLAARPVSSPLGLLDCDVPIDGSIAFVVSHVDRAADCPNPAIRIHAMGQAPDATGWIERPDYPKMASTDAAADLWSRTDLRPADVDLAELYDGFTFLTLAWLEALGFCGDGESGPYVEGGTRIALDGQLPLNTYGGQLSAGRMHGYWVLHEACVQLRGQAGERQVRKPVEVAAVSNGGGPIAGCLLVTR